MRRCTQQLPLSGIQTPSPILGATALPHSGHVRSSSPIAGTSGSSRYLASIFPVEEDSTNEDAEVAYILNTSDDLVLGITNSPTIFSSSERSELGSRTVDPIIIVPDSAEDTSVDELDISEILVISDSPEPRGSIESPIIVDSTDSLSESIIIISSDEEGEVRTYRSL